MELALEIISGIVVFSSILILIWKILGNSGIKLKKRVDQVVERKTYEPSKKECTKVFVYSMLFRVFVILVGFLIYCIFLETSKHIKFDQIAEIWNIWDAKHYISISNSYTSFINDRRFCNTCIFPALSMAFKSSGCNYTEFSNIRSNCISALYIFFVCIFI